MIDRKEQILDVTAELLLARSFNSFSYKDLSDRLGISKATIHHHFIGYLVGAAGDDEEALEAR